MLEMLSHLEPLISPKRLSQARSIKPTNWIRILGDWSGGGVLLHPHFSTESRTGLQYRRGEFDHCLESRRCIWQINNKANAFGFSRL